MIEPTNRLRETLGKPEFARFLQRLRRRLEQGRPLAGTLTLANVTQNERDAFNRLLGRMPTRGDSLAVDLELLERRLIDARMCEDLAQAVGHLTGPVINLSEERRKETAQWESLFNNALIQIESRPELKPWLEQLRSQGLLRRYGAEQAKTLLAQALMIAKRLPVDGVAIAELAASTVGDAHALDLHQPLGTLTIRLASILGGVERWDDAASRRNAWASLGVLLDDLSAPVLVLNLRAVGHHPIDQVLNTYADFGEPCHLTLRQLRRTPPGFATAVTGNRVFVCENPNVVGVAADRLGRSCAPLICTEGQAKTTVHILLHQLTEASIQLLYHGDFDWPGIQMANAIIARHGAFPWRMSASDYCSIDAGDFKLSGVHVQPSWDPVLLSEMLNIGRAIHEEQVIDHLLTDLKTR